MIRQFQKFLQGLCAVRARVRPTEGELQVVAKVARDSIPAIRLPLIEALFHESQSQGTLAQRTGIPQSSVHYRLEDLEVLGIARVDNRVWSLTEEFQRLCEEGRVFPQLRTAKRKKALEDHDQAA